MFFLFLFSSSLFVNDQGLVKQNFLSAPVLMKTKHRWYGFIDIGDIVQFYVENFGGALFLLLFSLSPSLH